MLKRELPDDPARLLAVASDGLAGIYAMLVGLGQQKEIRYAEVWRIAARVGKLMRMIERKEHV